VDGGGVVGCELVVSGGDAAEVLEPELGRRLMTMPGVGPVLASAMVASVPDPHAFRSGRNLAAWIGLVPKQNSSG